MLDALAPPYRRLRRPRIVLVSKLRLTSASAGSDSCAGVVRDLGQHSQQRAGYHDRTGVPQRGSRLPLGSTSAAHSRAHRQVVRGAQVRVHPQLAVDERGDASVDRCSVEPNWRGAYRRVALRGELGGQPGERATEHMSRDRPSPSSSSAHSPIDMIDGAHFECSARRPDDTRERSGRPGRVVRIGAIASDGWPGSRASAWRPRWMRLRTVPSFTPSVAPISS